MEVNNQNRIYKLLLIITLGFDPIKLLFDRILSFIPNALLDISFYLFYVVLVVYCLKSILYKNNNSAIIIFGIWLLYCLIMILTCPQDSQLYLREYTVAMPRCFLFFIIGRSIYQNYDDIKDTVVNIPLILIIVSTINFIMYGVKGEIVATTGYVREISYSMQLGHSCIFATSLAVAMLIFDDRKRVQNVISTIIGIVLIVGAGSRGPLVCVLAVLGICCIIKIVEKGTYFLIPFLILTLMLFTFESASILLVTRAIFEQLDLSTRIIDSLSSLSIEVSGRDSIYDIAFSGIKEHPLFGFGLYRDRIYIFQNWNTYLKYYHADSSGYYPHNIIVELIMQFGLPIGTIINIVILRNIRNAFISSYQSKQFSMFISVLSAGYIILLFSKSYIMMPMFYLFFGYSIAFSQQAMWSEDYEGAEAG